MKLFWNAFFQYSIMYLIPIVIIHFVIIRKSRIMLISIPNIVVLQVRYIAIFSIESTIPQMMLDPHLLSLRVLVITICWIVSVVVIASWDIHNRK